MLGALEQLEVVLADQMQRHVALGAALGEPGTRPLHVADQHLVLRIGLGSGHEVLLHAGDVAHLVGDAGQGVVRQARRGMAEIQGFLRELGGRLELAIAIVAARTIEVRGRVIAKTTKDAETIFGRRYEAFMQAFQSLKGGGQITEKEGRAAQEALSRLQATNMNEGDYKQALKDFRKEVGDLVALAKQKAGTGAPVTSAPVGGRVSTDDPMGLR